MIAAIEVTTSGPWWTLTGFATLIALATAGAVWGHLNDRKTNR